MMTFGANESIQSTTRNKESGYITLSTADTDPLRRGLRDSIQAHVSTEQEPTIISISDIHGFLDAGRSALLTLTDHPNFEPVVTQDDDGLLHWAGNDYVLIFNGDLIDRGPNNTETLQMVSRLINEAPLGRVRVTLGNHEMAILTPSLFMWDSMFSGRVSASGRRSLVQDILNGHIIASYQGYNVTYAHAGSAEEISVEAVNDELIAAAQQMQGLIGGGADESFQQQIVDDHPFVLGIGKHHPKGSDAGLVWIDFRHLPPDSPPQVVGHTKHDTVTQKGQLVCENVIRNNIETAGGEAVVVETPEELVALQREPDGSVATQTFSDL